MNNQDKCIDLAKLFYFDSICKIIRLLPKVEHENKEIVFNYRDNNYTILVNNNDISLICSDGRKLDISVASNTLTNTIGITNVVHIQLNYKVSDTAKIRLYKVLENTVFSDLEEIEPYQLEKYDYLFYANADNLHFTSFKNDGIDDIVFTENGIKYNEFFISNDCDKVLLMNGESVPSKEEIESFDLDKEKQIYIDSIKNSSLTSKTKEILINNFDSESILIYYKKLEMIYDKLPYFKDAINFRNKLYFSNDNKSIMFDNEEMEMFTKILYSEFKQEIEENDIIDEKVEDAIQFVKTLTLKAEEAIKKLIDGQ